MTQLALVRGRQVALSLQNKSGELLPEGSVVVQHPGYTRAFTTATAVEQTDVLGVLARDVKADEFGPIVTHGYVPKVLTYLAVQRGDFLETCVRWVAGTGSTAGRAHAVPVGSYFQMGMGVFALALSVDAGPRGEVSAYLFGVDSGRPEPYGYVVLTAEQGWPSTTNGCAAAAKTEYGTHDIDMYSLDFDKDADEHAQWTIGLPTWSIAESPWAQVFWTCSGGSPAETVTWVVQGHSLADGVALDVAWGGNEPIEDTWIADDRVHITALTFTNISGGDGNDLGQFRVFRDVSEDDLGCDAKLLMVILRYLRK